MRLSAESGSVGTSPSYSGKKLAINDIDGDGRNEIVIGVDVSIFFFSSTPIIRILSWDGRTLATRDSKEWTNATNIEDISIGDVDADGTIEIVTVGYSWSIMMPTPTQSELAIWSVSKVASSITVSVSSPSIVIGSQVIIRGRVTDETSDNPIPNVEVTIEFSREPLPVLTIGKVVTNENGEYTFTWMPENIGNYMIRVSWKGNYEHGAAAATTTLTVEKASSIIVLALSSYTVNVGDNITINGILYPAKTATIMLQYTSPNGSISTKTVNSNSAGMFSDTFTADQAGEWQIKAMWNGDEKHKSAESTTIMLTAQQPDTTTPILTIGGLILGIIALILAAVSLLKRSKKPEAAPPSQTQPQRKEVS
ncbi:MAG: carboxypeptidase regulatory-like domain-containing protein [Candidatus Bathyarchaeia archaeon]